MSNPHSAPLSVLVVEDDPDTAASAAEMLRSHGHRVAVARTGGEAAAAAPPDVILLDLKQPDLERWEVARRFQAQAAGLVKRPLLIAVSGCDSTADRGRSAAAGVDLHLIKPVDPAVLSGILRRFGRLLAVLGGRTLLAQYPPG